MSTVVAPESSGTPPPLEAQERVLPKGIEENGQVPEVEDASFRYATHERHEGATAATREGITYRIRLDRSPLG